MNESNGSEPEPRAAVTDVAENDQVQPPTSSSDATVQPKPAPPPGRVTRKSRSERLTGVTDPKPVARKRTPRPKPEPKPAPRTITYLDQEWDAGDHPDGYALAVEFAGGAE